MLSLRNMKYKVLPWLRASLTAQLAMKETWLDSWIRKIHWRSYRLPTFVFLGFPCGSAGKESACNAGDLGLIPGLGRSPGEGKGYTFQYSDLENSMESIIHGVPKSRTQLNDFHFTSLSRTVAQIVKNSPVMQETRVQPLGQENPLEKGMTSHYTILPGEFHGRRILVGYSQQCRKKSDTTE